MQTYTYSLPTTSYPRPTIYCYVLPTTYYLITTTYYLLLTTTTYDLLPLTIYEFLFMNTYCYLPADRTGTVTLATRHYQFLPYAFIWSQVGQAPPPRLRTFLAPC